MAELSRLEDDWSLIRFYVKCEKVHAYNDNQRSLYIMGPVLDKK